MCHLVTSFPIQFNTLICLLLSLSHFLQIFFIFLLWELCKKKNINSIIFVFQWIVFFCRPNKLFYSLKCIHRNTEIIFQKSGYFFLLCLFFIYFLNSADAFNIILGWFHNLINFSTLPFFFLELFNLESRLFLVAVMSMIQDSTDNM